MENLIVGHVSLNAIQEYIEGASSLLVFKNKIHSASDKYVVLMKDKFDELVNGASDLVDGIDKKELKDLEAIDGFDDEGELKESAMAIHESGE